MTTTAINNVMQPISIEGDEPPADGSRAALRQALAQVAGLAVGFAGGLAVFLPWPFAAWVALAVAGLGAIFAVVVLRLHHACVAEAQVSRSEPVFEAVAVEAVPQISAGAQ